jgi:hypothetical protein
MCHRRGDRSRTSSSVSEPESEREEDSTWWPSRAAKRLVTFVSDGEEESDRETPDRPAVEAEPEVPTETETPDEAETTDEHEREEDPIPADD